MRSLQLCIIWKWTLLNWLHSSSAEILLFETFASNETLICDPKLNLKCKFGLMSSLKLREFRLRFYLKQKFQTTVSAKYEETHRTLSELPNSDKKCHNVRHLTSSEPDQWRHLNRIHDSCIVRLTRYRWTFQWCMCGHPIMPCCTENSRWFKMAAEKRKIANFGKFQNNA